MHDAYLKLNTSTKLAKHKIEISLPLALRVYLPYRTRKSRKTVRQAQLVRTILDLVEVRPENKKHWCQRGSLSHSCLCLHPGMQLTKLLKLSTKKIPNHQREIVRLTVEQMLRQNNRWLGWNKDYKYQFKTYAFLMEDKIAVGAFGHAVNYGCDDPFYYHARQQQKQQQQQIS